MKPRNYPILALLALIIGGAIWLFSRTPGGVTIDTYTEASPAQTAAPKTAVAQAAPAAQVELPKAAAVGAKDGSNVDPNASAQAELKAAFLDMGRLIRAGDYVAYHETYFYTPNQTELDAIERAKVDQVRTAAKRASNPDNPNTRQVIQLNEVNAQAIEALANQTPTFNTAGDEATYQYIDPDYETGTYPGTGEATPLTFIKIDGRWYRKPSNYKKPDGQGK